MSYMDDYYLNMKNAEKFGEKDALVEKELSQK